MYNVRSQMLTNITVQTLFYGGGGVVCWIISCLGVSAGFLATAQIVLDRLAASSCLAKLAGCWL